MELIKPCPFCGGEAELIIAPGYFKRGLSSSGWLVKCMNGCCNQMPFQSDHEAVDAWNSRKTQDAPDASTGKWISVKDRLPEEEGSYLVARRKPFGATTIAWYSGPDDGWLALDGGFYSDGVVTHYMPLPEQPKEDARTDA